jgi:iron(III) transport system ATP-binding protein
MDHLLEILDISCGYHREPVVDGLSLHIRPGMLSCLLGPSGCGKTTVLRAIAGFEPVRRGEVRLSGTTISRPGYTLAPEARRLGMVFQDYALFPHLSAADNVTFGLRRLSRGDRRRRASELMALVGLAGLENRFPHELSGGQQQRVAVARALAPSPQLLLLDEPFSNLDVDLRERLALDVRDILKAQGAAAIFVTHDQQEAFLIGERVGVMRDGKIRQWASPFELYHEPTDRFVADFIGQGRFLQGTLIAPDIVDTELGHISGNTAYAWPSGRRVDVLLRPDDVVIDRHRKLRAQIVERAFKGAATLYTLRLPSGCQLLSLMPSHEDHAVGEQVGVAFTGEHLVLFERE